MRKALVRIPPTLRNWVLNLPFKPKVITNQHLIFVVVGQFFLGCNGSKQELNMKC